MTTSCWRFSLIFVLLAASAQARQPPPGVWTGYLMSPQGTLLEARFGIHTDEQGAYGVLEWEIGQFQMEDLEMSDDRISFAWQASDRLRIECRVRRGEGDAFVGGCKDLEGNIGGMMMSPPGVPPSPDEMSERAAFEAWGVNREAYLRHARLRKQGTGAFGKGASPLASPEGTTVRVGEASYRVHLAGEASPYTVVFVSDLGEGLDAWSGVVHLLEDTTRVFSYDRSGLGGTDTSNPPVTLDGMAGELADVLEASGAAPPYVLVGHGLGALIVRRYARLYADEAAGLVLVHPAHERQASVLSAVDSAGWERYWSGRQRLHEAMPGPVQREFEVFATVLGRRPEPDLAAGAEVPAIVLTGSRTTDPPRWVGETDAGFEALRTLHAEAASESIPDAHRLVASGPHVPREAWTEIDRAVRDMLAHLSGLSE